METVKVYKKCGRELPIGAFGKVKDGVNPVCKDCRNAAQRENYKRTREMAQKAKVENALSCYTPRELIDELRARGYKGTLTYTHKIEL